METEHSRHTTAREGAEPGTQPLAPKPPFSPRRRLLIQLSPALLSLVLLIGLFIYDARHPQPWQVELNAYLAGRSGLHAVALLTAERPEAFTGAMPFHPTGTSNHYRLGPEDPTGRTGKTGRTPLPYPPDEIWCVLLATSPQDPEAPLPTPGPGNVILIARHADLYAADWLVHETPPDARPASVTQALAEIGCDFAAVR